MIALLAPVAASRWVAVAGALVALGLAIGLVADFDSSAAGLQHVVDESWIPDLGVRYQLGVDGISVFLVLMTAILWFAVTLWSALRNEPGDGRSRLYYFLVGLAGTAALGAFMAQDLLLFVLFFDLMLIPFFFLIGTFGGENRIAATTKMIVYTLVGSLLMLVGAIATAILSSDSVGELSFSIPVLQEHLLSTGSQEWIFCFFAAAFLVKMPAFPIHGWMPDAYRAAPLPVLILLSAVLSKVGAYGFLRVALPLFPNATSEFQEVVMLIALASILYGSVMAFTQTNIRLIAGYSSIAQLGFITLGIFSLRADGADGAVLQMVNHALVVAGIFMVIAIVYARTRTEDVTRMGGQAMRAPVLAALFLVLAMANLAMPGLGQLHGRVLHPQRRLSVEDRVRLRRRDRDRAGCLLQPADVPAGDAQPAARGRRVARDRDPRRDRARAPGRRDRRPGALAGADPRARRGLGDREGRCRRGGDRERDDRRGPKLRPRLDRLRAGRRGR